MINIQFFMFVPVEYYEYNPTQKWQMYTALSGDGGPQTI